MHKHNPNELLQMKEKLSQSEQILCPKNSDTDYLHDYIELLKKGITENTSNESQIKFDTLQNQINNLSAKFDVWQAQTENIISATQGAMDYTNIVMTVAFGLTALGATAFTILFSNHISKQQKEANEAAIKTIKENTEKEISEIENNIANGLLPETSGIRKKLLETIINSAEFQSAVRKSAQFVYSSLKAEEEEARKIPKASTNDCHTDNSIDNNDFDRAQEAEENGINETESLDSGNIIVTENTPEKKGE